MGLVEQSRGEAEGLAARQAEHLLEGGPVRLADDLRGQGKEQLDAEGADHRMATAGRSVQAGGITRDGAGQGMGGRPGERHDGHVARDAPG